MERTTQTVGVLGRVRLLTLRHKGPPGKASTPLRLGLLAAFLLIARPAIAQLTATPMASPPPATVAAPLQTLLSPDAHKVAIGSTTLEFWWVKALPVAGGGPAAWSQVAEGALVGVVRVTGAFKEIRGKTVNPGVYTLRLGLQPQNGDHLGASPFREFLLLSPASVDADPKPLGFDATVAVSKQTIGTSHPAALSLDPPVSSAAVLSSYANELDHKGLTFQVATTPAGTLKFGLILVGVIEP